MAGETIMKGFVGIKLSSNVIRLITMFPAMVIIIIGVNPMLTLLLSQVFLSFALPIAIIPMLIISSRKDLMGVFVNSRLTNILGILVTAVIVLLNAVLLFLTFSGGI